MKINRAVLTYGVAKTFKENVDFSHVELDPNHVRKIENCVVKATATDYETILRIELEINALVIGVCSYSLEDVELKLKIEDEINFSDDENDPDCYFCNDTIIDLGEYILGILLANVPVRIVKKGAKLPEDGKGYRVISQDQYEKEKENSSDPRWDKLNELDL